MYSQVTTMGVVFNVTFNYFVPSKQACFRLLAPYRRYVIMAKFKKQGAIFALQKIPCYNSTVKENVR